VYSASNGFPDFWTALIKLDRLPHCGTGNSHLWFACPEYPFFFAMTGGLLHMVINAGM